VLTPSGIDVSNHRTVDEVVEGVADEHEGRGAVVHLAIMRVAVPPEHQLFQDEEEEDTGEQCRERLCRRQLLERLRQDCEQRHAEQGADGVADEPRHQLRAGGIGEEKKTRGDQEAAQPAKQAQPEGYRERRHVRDDISRPEIHDAT
jgi:hypothetical protein